MNYIINGDYVKKIFIFIIAIICIAFMLMPNNESIGLENDYDTSYYVEAENNIFVKSAKIIDDITFKLVDIILKGIDSCYETLSGN